jgi:hypothetical protein
MSDWIAERRRRFEAKADMGDMLPMLGRFLVEEPAVLEILGGARELERRWDALCDCVNEFEPEDMMACNERRDDLGRDDGRADRRADRAYPGRSS